MFAKDLDRDLSMPDLTSVYYEVCVLMVLGFADAGDLAESLQAGIEQLQGDWERPKE